MAIYSILDPDATVDGQLDYLNDWTKEHLAAPDPHPQYVQPEDLPQTTGVYLSAVANTTYPGEYSLISTRPTLAESGISTTVDGDDVLCGTFTRDPALQQDIYYNELETRVLLDLDGVSRDTTAYVKVLLRPGAGGADIELGTSGPATLSDTRMSYVFIVQILGPVTAATGDYTIIEVYSTKVGGGPNRTVTINVDGLGVSRALTYIPIPAYPAEHSSTHETGGSDEIEQLTDATNLLASHVHDGGDGTIQVSHSDLLNRYSANQHRIANVTDLEDELNAKVYSAYIEMSAPTNQAVPNLGAAWEDLDGMTPDITPFHFTDGGNGQFIPEYASVYRLSISGAFEHNSSNSGRGTFIRLYNHTDGAAGVELILPTGRNQEATQIGISTLFDVPPADVGKSFGFQVGGGDTYTSVVINAINYSINNTGIVQQ